MSSPADTQSATDRLLDVLRGKPVSEPDSAAIHPIPAAPPEPSVGLSDEEQQALMGPSPASPGRRQKTGPASVSGRRWPALTLPQWTLPQWTLPSLGDCRRMVEHWLGAKRGFISLDIGTKAIKYLEFEEGPNGRVLTNYGGFTFEDVGDDPELIAEDRANRLRTLLGGSRIQSHHIFTAVYGPQTSIRHILLPKVAKKDLHDAILWNAKKDLPFDADAALLDYRVLGEVKDKGTQKLSILVALAEESVIRDHLAMLTKAGIAPSRVVVIPLALFQAFQAIALEQGITDGIIIDIGANTSYILFIKGSLLQFAREINIGGDDITKSLMGTVQTETGPLTLSREDAEALKVEIGVPDPAVYSMTRFGITTSQIDTLMGPAVDRLTTNIQRTMDYYRSKFSTTEADRLYLSGGTARLLGFQARLSEELGKEVVLLDPFGKVSLGPAVARDQSFAKAKTSFAVAYGIGASGTKGLNLLPADIKAIPIQSMQLRTLKAAAIFVGLLLGSLTLATYGNSDVHEARLIETKAKLQALGGAERETMALQQQREALASQHNTLSSSINVIGQAYDVIGVMQMLSRLTPRYIRLNEIIIAENGANRTTIRGTLLDAGAQVDVLLAQYGVTLEHSKLFLHIEPYKQFPTEDATSVDFEYVCIFQPQE